jgi:hypothetical protein
MSFEKRSAELRMQASELWPWSIFLQLLSRKQSWFGFNSLHSWLRYSECHFFRAVARRLPQRNFEVSVRGSRVVLPAERLELHPQYSSQAPFCSDMQLYHVPPPPTHALGPLRNLPYQQLRTTARKTLRFLFVHFYAKMSINPSKTFCAPQIWTPTCVQKI